MVVSHRRIAAWFAEDDRYTGFTKPHILWLDQWTRIGLLVAGALGAYSLGANNIANVVGVFVPASPLGDVNVGGIFTLAGPQHLFGLGGLAITDGLW